MATLDELIELVYSLKSGDYDDEEGYVPGSQLFEIKFEEFIRLSTKLEIRFASAKHNGSTLLHAVCSRYLDEFVIILIENGADPGALDNDGNTPLMIVAKNNSTTVAEYLCQLPINHYVKNKDGLDAIACAAISNNLSALESIIDELEDRYKDGLQASKQAALECVAIEMSKGKSYGSKDYRIS